MIHGDGIHPVALNKDGKLERTAQFDWGSVRHNVDGEGIDEDTVTWSDMTASFSLLLQWACRSNSLTNVGARVASLLAFLDPVNAPHKRNTLSAIAKEAGCTKALLSRELLELRDQCGIHLTVGKRSFSRESCRTAQFAAVKAGVHSGISRRDSKKRKAAEQISLNAIAD
jgi:hypothetical protein